MKNLADLGVELKARRQALEKTQAALGAEAGLRQEVLSRLERGQLADLSVAKLLRVAHTLGLELMLVPHAPHRPTLDTLLLERRQGANTGPGSR